MTKSKELKTQVEKTCRELGIPYYKDKPFNPEPSALGMWPIVQVSKEELKKLYPEPTARMWVNCAGCFYELGKEPRGYLESIKIKVIEYSAFERLQRENKALKLDAYDHGMTLLEDKIVKLQAALDAKEAKHKAFCENAQEKTDADFKVVREAAEQARAELATEIEQHAITSRDVSDLRKDYLELETAAREREGKLVRALERIVGLRPPKLMGYGPNVGENAVVIASKTLAEHEKETK